MNSPLQAWPVSIAVGSRKSPACACGCSSSKTFGEIGWSQPINLRFPKDAIDPRIDVDAQRALVAMSASSDPNVRRDAIEVLSMVKTRRLLGIYKVDQRVPALAAKRQGMGWWQLLEPDFAAATLKDPAAPGAGPLLVLARYFRGQPLINLLRSVAQLHRDGMLE